MKPTGPQYLEVERVENVTLEEYRSRHIRSKKPIRFINGAKTWPAASKWSFEWLREHYGKRLCWVRGSGSGDGLRPLEEYIDEIQDGRAPSDSYIANFQLQLLQELKADLDLRWKSPTTSVTVPQLFLGTAGSGVGWHTDNRGLFDHTGNTVFQAVGRKEWWLAAPEEGPYMYEPPFHPSIEHRGRRSPINHLAPDLERFPLYAKAKVYRVVLEPGDLMFVPGGYWHATNTVEAGFSVGCWYPVDRVTDVALHAHDEVIHLKLGKDHHDPLTMADIEEFGGIEKFSDAWRPDGLMLCDKRILLRHLHPEALHQIDGHREAHGLPTLRDSVY